MRTANSPTPYHIMDFGDEEFEIYIMNTEEIVRNMDELVRIAGRYV